MPTTCAADTSVALRQGVKQNNRKRVHGFLLANLLMRQHSLPSTPTGTVCLVSAQKCVIGEVKAFNLYKNESWQGKKTKQRNVKI